MEKPPHSSDQATAGSDKIICDALENLLHVATGRSPIGDIDEILLRLVRRATCLSPPYDSDFPKLTNAIWSVLVSDEIDEKLKIGGTTTGISGETTRFDFVRQYANNFVFETPDVEYCFYHPTENVSECFEETLVGLAALWRVDFESFSFFTALPILIAFCRKLNSRFDAVCESFLLALSTIESVAWYAGGLIGSDEPPRV